MKNIYLRFAVAAIACDCRGIGAPGAIMTTTSRPFFAERKRIVELAGKYRLPAIYFQKESADVELLVSREFGSSTLPRCTISELCEYLSWS